MSQATNPHPRLLECRNAIQAAGHSRIEAAELCGGLTNEQVDDILGGKSVADVLTPQPAKVDPPKEPKKK